LSQNSDPTPEFRLPKIGPVDEVYRDKVQVIRRVEADFGSFKKEYFVREAGTRSGVLLVRDDSVLLVRQYRLQINALSWEIPGGKVDGDESPDQAAIRECREESGIHCRNLKPLAFYHPGLDVIYNPSHLFWTSEFDDSVGLPDTPDEVVALEWVPLKQCNELIASGQLADAFTMIAILAYQQLTNVD
jgi:ADP-ribose pyrophosphatase